MRHVIHVVVFLMAGVQASLSGQAAPPAAQAFDRLKALEGEWIDVYRVPAGDAYREHRRAAGGDTVAPAAFPDVVVTVADVFA